MITTIELTQYLGKAGHLLHEPKFTEAAQRLRELEAQLAATAWQPIETAPKDTEILCISKKDRIANAIWVVVNGEMGYWAWPYINVEPAHWMPLPKEQP